MIVVDSVEKVYQETPVVSDVSFEVKSGQTLILLGTSGSGKTTILKMINRLIEPSAGSIRLDGKDIRQEQPESLRRKIGYVIQQSGLFPHYTVDKNIGIVPSLLGWSESRVEQRVGELIQTVGLSAEQRTRYPHELSGGQQQRVGIARALAADPPVVLMDEPFGALDPITKQQMTQEFASLGMLREKTVVLVTHDVVEAFTLGDSICLLDQGEMQQWGSPKELLFRPKNDFVRSFFRTQRLRLALEVLTVDDVLKFCQTENVSAPTEAPAEVTKAASVFAALDEMERKRATNVAVIRSNTTNLILDRSQLLQGFFEYQRAYATDQF